MTDVKGPDAIARFRDLDTARGGGMLLVVVGHMPQFAAAKFWIYLFHMPLFFIVSGILFKPRSPWSYSMGRTRSLMLPYLVFFAVVLLFDNAIAQVSGVAPSLNLADPRQIILRFFYGGPSLYGAYAAFWFVGCLWISLVVLNSIGSIGKPTSWSAAIIIVGFIAIAMIEHPGLPSPQGIASVPIAVVFLWSGCVLAEQRHRRHLIFAICAILSILSLPFVGAFDMKMSAVGNLANIVAAFSLSACWLGVSYHLDRVAYVGYALAAIGRASITIMFLHALFLVHGAALIGNRYLLAIVALIAPVCVHWLLESNAIISKYVFGRSFVV